MGKNDKVHISKESRAAVDNYISSILHEKAYFFTSKLHDILNWNKILNFKVTMHVNVWK